MEGIGVSPGAAVGRALLFKEPCLEINRKYVPDVLAENERFLAAVAEGKKQLEKAYHDSVESIGEKEAQIFEAQKLFLDDPLFAEKITQIIKDENSNAEWAVQKAAGELVKLFNNIENDYIRERVADIRDVSKRIIQILLGKRETDFFEKIAENTVIIAMDLAPSDVVKLDRHKVVGLVIESGGKTSHTAILAKTLGIPAVVGIENVTAIIKEKDTIIIDGDEGLVYPNPNTALVERYQAKSEAQRDFKKRLLSFKGLKTETKDGVLVELAANIRSQTDVSLAMENDCEGIGLFRTEFIYMDRNSPPSEMEQFLIYKKVAQELNGKPVTIRTMDIGGDKKLPYLNLPEEANPFLGYRAIRFCLDRRDIFKVQLRALLRASSFGNIQIMFPMISGMEELRSVKQILIESQAELEKEQIPFNKHIKVGIMIELSAAAIISDWLATEVDFFSIGINDLIQYSVAVDRTNPTISYLHNQFNPALLRLIKSVIDNGHGKGITVGICGEAASDPRFIPLLVGMDWMN